MTDMRDTETGTLEQRELYSQDIWAKGETAAAILSPQSTEELSDIVKTANARGLSINPRGGGMSYTKGYIPENGTTAILDFSGMNRIIEINEEDMYVTVQAGCTWKTLYEALGEKGLRTPFWGPLSGISSTIGGGLSQNNAFFGGSLYDTSTASALSVTVVLADGTIVKTGTGGTKNAKPFYRHFGPDLTGLFMGDTGALGYKTEATLRLIPVPEHEDWASFECDSHAGWITALKEMGRLGLACELFGFDPNLQRVRMERAGLAADIRTLGNVITKQKSGLVRGLKEGARVAMAGRGFMDATAYSLHIVVEGHSSAEVGAKMTTLKTVAHRFEAREIENSIPKIIRANPFTPLNNILGPRGERWVPIHGIVAMSDALTCFEGIHELFNTMQGEFDSHGVTPGFLTTILGTTGYLIEPVFIWPEEIWPIHKVTVDPGTLRRATTFDKNPDATAVVLKARRGILDIFTAHGAAHFQIGRTYPYRETRDDNTWKLIRGIKSLLDPERRVNPGSLGL